MAAKRSRKKRPASNPSNGDAATPNLLRSLASVIVSAQGSKLPIVKSLYYLLVHMSSSEPISWAHCNAASHDLSIKSSGKEEELNLVDVGYLSDVLFAELDTRFKEVFSALHKQNNEPSSMHLHTKTTVEELTLLLRCCITITSLLITSQELALGKGRALLSILNRLISVEPTVGDENESFVFTKSVSHEYMHNDDGHASSVAEDFVSSIYLSELSNPCCTFLCTVLEVFADELLTNKMVRELLLLIDSASSSSKMHIMRGVSWCDIGSVLEVISAHFILSVSDERAIKMFFGRLFWQQNDKFRTPHISLNAAISLLLNPVMFSAPKMFHAYLVLLVSDAIGISKSPDSKALVLKVIDRYLAAFERSTSLYTRHMCNLDKAGNHMSESSSFGKSCVPESNSQVDFECHLLPSTWKKMTYLITKINDSWSSYLRNMSGRENAELVASSVAYVRESLHIFDNFCSEEILSEILSIVGCIILRASSDDVTDAILHTDRETSTQDLFLLASIVKLMSCSMLQAICCLENGRNLGLSEPKGDVSACKEYDVMMRIVERFQQFSVSLPVQSFLFGIMESHPQRHTKSKWMLLHFSGLLSLSYASKLDFLMKASIFGILTLLYLFTYEEGDLEALRPLVGPRSKSSLSTSSVGCGELTASGKAGEAVGGRKSTQAVALKFKKVRTLYLGKVSSSGSDQVDQTRDSENSSGLPNMDSAVGIQEDTCNGESFLRCVLETGSCNSSDVDDLANFIVCKPGKDYSDWLRGRQMFRQRWKSEKVATYRWNKKKKAWRESKGKRA